MRCAARGMLLMVLLGAVLAHAQTVNFNKFKHVVVIFQENRTPDNLFNGLTPKCAGVLTAKCYDIATSGLALVGGTDTTVTLTPITLANDYDLSHAHTAFESMCNPDSTGVCKMDGANLILDTCTKGSTDCTNQGKGQFLGYKFVDNSTGTVQPYLDLATQYGWANRMFQTNQGPSYPAHQFIFGGTSAVSAPADAAGTFVSENPGGAAPGTSANSNTGCLAPLNQTNMVISPNTGACPTGCTCFNNNTVKECTLLNNPQGAFCYTRNTMPVLFNATTSWKYYAPKQTTNPGGANPEGSIWTAPASISGICVPDATFGTCTGPAFTGPNPNVDLNPADVLTDIAACNLASVSWVIPTGQNSDHAKDNNGNGPSWVTSIVNAIGSNPACGPSKEVYWQDTAIIITWDDWGGWYDHVAPTTLSGSQGTYQYGFRVPLVVVSAYTPQGYINNATHDFGSILRFIQAVFNGPTTEGALGFADKRATNDLRDFISLTAARSFTTINAPVKAAFFKNDKSPQLPPDDD
jgi:phospholipase C